MKQRDIFAIAMLAIIMAIGAWILTNTYIASEENRTAEIEQVPAYATDFDKDTAKGLLDPNIVDFTRDPNLDAGGSDHTLTPSP